MYAICVEYYGKYGAIVPLGNDGLQKLHNKTRRGWLKETECMRIRTTGNVYVVLDFTQKCVKCCRDSLQIMFRTII